MERRVRGTITPNSRNVSNQDFKINSLSAIVKKEHLEEAQAMEGLNEYEGARNKAKFYAKLEAREEKIH